MTARLPVTPGGPMCRCVHVHAPRPVTLEHHHIWPQGRGGPTVAGNLIWLCLPPGSPVRMASGADEAIEDVRPGNRVIGHDGLAHTVTSTIQSEHSGDLVLLDGRAMTPGHPVLTPSGWRPARALSAGDLVLQVESVVLRDHLPCDSTDLPGNLPEARAFRSPVADEDVVQVGSPLRTPPTIQPTRGMFSPQVFSVTSYQDEIFGPVVITDMVPMMNNLGRHKATAKHLLHHGTVLVDDSPFLIAPYDHDPVALGGRPAGALAPGVLSLDAGVVPAPTWSGAEPRHLSSTLSAGAFRGKSLATFGAAHQQWLGATTSRGAFGAACGVLVSEGGRAPEPDPALGADLLGQAERLSCHARWYPINDVARRRFKGNVHDISVQGCESFITAGLAVHNCGTAHNNVHAYLDVMLATGGRRPPNYRQYGPHVRALAELGYRRIQAQALVD